MARDSSPNEDIVDRTIGEDRSRSRERGEQPRGRHVRRQVANPFRSPGRRAPLSADAWFRQGEGYPISPAPYGGPPLPAERPEEAFAMGADQAESTRAAGAAAAKEAAQDSPMEDVTMAEWVDWFHAAFDQDPQDLDVLKWRLSSAIRFDTKVLDAESRVGRMLDDLMQLLEQDHQEWVLHQEGKIVVEIMTKAIKPETLKTAVKKQLQLQRNKGLKSDVFRYVKRLRQFSAGFQLYVGLDEVTAPAPQAGASKTDSLKSGRGKPDGADKSRGRPDGPEKGRGRSDGKGRADGRASGVEKPAVTGEREDYKPRKKLGCLKCGDKSDYVADCPAATPGEADRLLDAQLKKWRDGVTVLSSHPNRHPTERGALVEGLVRVEYVLLDTGADVNVVSRVIMDELAEKNATVAVQVHHVWFTLMASTSSRWR
ncbi:hypothetical protein DYB32_010205 [Aphanomyces invadans]|uniref:Peptidase A2 domain-containing protein n=1 Tax=Aphanomyces invadans TaxID=157072 RepID=A0A418AGG1_9STRA|nr:hypothetical protein DYB32_010205 [Aphanomyces invadans]